MALGPIDGPAISMFQPHVGLEGAARVTPSIKADGEGFGSLFIDAIKQANIAENKADAAQLDLAAGRTDDIHNTMIAVQKAGIETKMVGTIRNKVVDAFYELWRMSV